jgi:hypothetical protein
VSREWSPHILEAAEAMYRRLRIVDKTRYPKWSKISIDAMDHYCVAAENAVRAFHESAVATIEVDD